MKVQITVTVETTPERWAAEFGQGDKLTLEGLTAAFDNVLDAEEAGGVLTIGYDEVVVLEA